MQLRVVVSMVLISLVVVAGAGALVLDRVTKGVLGSRLHRAQAEASSGFLYAQSGLSELPVNDPDAVDVRLETLAQQLAARAGQEGSYGGMLIGSLTSSVFFFGAGPQTVNDVPASLRGAVAEQGLMAYTYAEHRRGREQFPALVIGAPVYAPTGQYELYFLFPLDEEAATIGLVRRTLLGGGLAIGALVALVAALLARQVVTPVRIAADIADRFASGELERRMSVRGEDELARLGEAFNAMAASLQQKIDQMQGLSRLQQRFVSDVSHELRTPLTTVRMAADVLHAARADFPPEVARSAELMQHELDRFESLLVDLLEISRFDAGAAHLDVEVVDLNALVDRLVDAHATFAARHGSDIVLRAPAERVVVEADPRRIERVLRNLVVNAIEHGEGLPVEVSIGANDEAVAIVVRDHGIGLRPGEASRVFNRFWRADPARSRRTGGTGLGLSIALEDTRLHGGWLQAWGQPGKGASFRLTLPRRVGGEFRASPLPLEPKVMARG